MAGTFQQASPVRNLVKFACLALLVLVLSNTQEVTSFSVGGRSARRSHDTRNNIDLAEALALLQRERRRVRSHDFITPGDLLGPEPLTAADVSDWLSKSRDSRMLLGGNDLSQYLDVVEQEPTWVSDGNFKEFPPQIHTVKPSQEEIEDLFSSDEKPGADIEDEKTDNDREIEKKKKRSSPKSERKLVKKSVPSPPAPVDDDSDLSLDTLTQEEFKALMKAVGKLQRQVAAKGSYSASQGQAAFIEEVSDAEPKQDMAIIQPASKEELQSLFAKDVGDEAEEEGEQDEESSLLPGSSVIIQEEEQTPEGGRRVFEVDTPQGGQRLTELEGPDGQQEVVEETLPEESMGDLQEAIKDSERELSDALASQLERDISEEAENEELEAEEEEAEQEAEIAAAAEAVVQAQSQQQEAVAAAKEEIAREIGADDLAALEKMWMSRDSALPPYAEKRTQKRAARSRLDGRYSLDAFRSQRIPDDITLERLLTNSDVADDDDDVDEDIINSINEGVKEAALEREILNERDIKNALNAINSGNGHKEDIIYGTPLTDDEYQIPEDSAEEDDIGFDNPPPSSTSLSIKRNRNIDRERLRQLANALSMNAADDENEEEDLDDNLLLDDAMEPSDATGDVAKVLTELGLDSSAEGHLPKEVFGLPPPLGQFVTRIVELQDEVGQLRVIAQLADLENDVLTDALNEATMAQAPGTVSDMEFESLQQAIWVEKELQRLKKGGSIAELDALSRAGSLGPAGSLKAATKRGEPWRRKRGKVQTGADVALPTLPASGVSHLSRPVSKDEMEKLLGETYISKGDVPDLMDLGLSEASVASIFLPNADQCPAVNQYSTNCELADLYSLPVDYEARALCNLHEMCYACGHSLHVPQASCDEVYRAAARTLCRKGSACVLEAEIFLRTMKLKTRYVPHTQPACRSTCTARFLGMI